MGRPAKFDEATALDAAMNHFWAVGYDRAGVSDLAAAMGLTRSSFYNSFGNRDALFQKVLARYGSIAPDRVLDAIGPNDPVLPVLADMLRDVCRTRAADRQARGCLVVNCLADAGSDGASPPGMRALLEARIKHLTALMAQAQNQGEVAPDVDKATLAGEFITFLYGLNLTSRIVRDEQALWRQCESFLRAHGLLTVGTSRGSRG
jgi:TetR/AcrR family transcriptional repressor of nem operon